MLKFHSENNFFLDYIIILPFLVILWVRRQGRQSDVPDVPSHSSMRGRTRISSSQSRGQTTRRRFSRRSLPWKCCIANESSSHAGFLLCKWKLVSLERDRCLSSCHRRCIVSVCLCSGEWPLPHCLDVPAIGI